MKTKIEKIVIFIFQFQNEKSKSKKQNFKFEFFFKLKNKIQFWKFWNLFFISIEKTLMWPLDHRNTWSCWIDLLYKENLTVIYTLVASASALCYSSLYTVRTFYNDPINYQFYLQHTFSQAKQNKKKPLSPGLFLSTRHKSFADVKVRHGLDDGLRYFNFGRC